MTVGDARTWVIGASLLVTFVVLVFLWVAPAAFGYPLDPARGEPARLIQIVLPVFFGYLGAASHFAFRDRDDQDRSDDLRLPSYAALLIRWPLVGWTALAGVALAVFWWTNRAGAPPDTGWSVDNLASALTVAMGLLAVTTGVAVSYLFAAKGKASGEDSGAAPSPAA